MNQFSDAATREEARASELARLKQEHGAHSEEAFKYRRALARYLTIDEYNRVCVRSQEILSARD